MGIYNEFIEIDTKKIDVKLDLRYTTINNITGKKIYLENKCFLHPNAYKKLVDASNLAKKFNYKLKIYDAYRPQYVQEKLWAFSPNSDFLLDPKIGSPHTRGVAIDLTLIDKHEKDLDMGTDFDDFTKKAYHITDKISLIARRNRAVLLSIMTLSGFDFYHKEWWHYQLFNSKNYKLVEKY